NPFGCRNRLQWTRGRNERDGHSDTTKWAHSTPDSGFGQGQIGVAAPTITCGEIFIFVFDLFVAFSSLAASASGSLSKVFAAAGGRLTFGSWSDDGQCERDLSTNSSQDV